LFSLSRTPRSLRFFCGPRSLALCPALFSKRSLSLSHTQRPFPQLLRSKFCIRLYTRCPVGVTNL
jgi:hypothetical protein